MEATVPEVHFDRTQARRIYPRPQLKQAVLVPIPVANGDNLPTFIQAEWGQVQVFYGNYYLIIKNGVGVYGSAREQWVAMHTEMRPGYWVKTAIPLAYQVTETCRIVTLIPTNDGSDSIREASFIMKSGDWAVLQPGGELQHIKQEKFNTIYFSKEEVGSLGLADMSEEEFARFAIETASRAMVGA